MPRPLVFFALLTLAAAPALLAAEQGDRVEAAGEFSYTAPAGWHVKTLPQSKYPIAFADPVNGFAPNINVIREGFSRSVQDYVRANLETMRKGLPEFANLGQTAFAT